MIAYYVFCIRRFCDDNIEEINKMKIHTDTKK